MPTPVSGRTGALCSPVLWLTYLPADAPPLVGEASGRGCRCGQENPASPSGRGKSGTCRQILEGSSANPSGLKTTGLATVAPGRGVCGTGCQRSFSLFEFSFCTIEPVGSMMTCKSARETTSDKALPKSTATPIPAAAAKSSSASEVTSVCAGPHVAVSFLPQGCPGPFLLLCLGKHRCEEISSI